MPLGFRQTSHYSLSYMPSLPLFCAPLLALFLFLPALAQAAHPHPAKASQLKAGPTPAGLGPAPTPSAVGSCPPPTAVGAQPAAPQVMYLSGTVVGADGLPCVGACVFATSNTHQIAVTDAKGIFKLSVPASTAVYLQADYFGLGSSRVAIGSQYSQPVRIILGQ